MISSAEVAVGTLVLQKQKEKTISPRLLELRKKIQDEDYIDNAILRIAQVISRKLVENPEELKMSNCETLWTSSSSVHNQFALTTC